MTNSRHLTVARLSDLESIRKLQAEWISLWHRQASATPFQRPEWLLPWIECFRPNNLWLLEVRDQGALVGVAPLFVYQPENGERALAILGAGISDYLDFIVDPFHAAEVVHAVFDFLEKTTSEWDRVELLDLRKESPLLSITLGEEWTSETAENDVCPRLVLPPGVEQLRQVMSSRQHRNLKTAINRVRRLGAVQITVADQATLSEHLHALLHLHGARWRESGKPGVLANAAVKEFHAKAAASLLEAGVLRLYALRLNSQPIATLYSLWGAEVVYLYLQGYDVAYADLSPGIQMIAAVVEDALHCGKQVIDFLRGREAYKYAWGACDETTFRRILRTGDQREVSHRALMRLAS